MWLEKRYKGVSDSLSGVCSAEGEVSISLLNLDRDFTPDIFLPLTVQNLSDPFPDTFSPISPSERLQKRFFSPLQKEPDAALLIHPAFEALISNMWLAPNWRLSQPFKKTLLIVMF